MVVVINFNICAAALFGPWRGNRDFGSDFYFWPPSLSGDERSGGHRGRLESDEGEEGQKAWLLEAGRQL